jgi:hypothetical protein
LTEGKGYTEFEMSWGKSGKVSDAARKHASPLYQ